MRESITKRIFVGACFTLLLFSFLLLTSCGNTIEAENILPVVEREELEYAKQFSIVLLEGGIKRIQLSEGTSYFVIPENCEVPSYLPKDALVIKQPFEKVFLSAPSTMVFIDQMGALQNIAMSATRVEDWSIAHAREAMEDGRIRYAGKYSAPDYEMLTNEKADLAIYSTMLNHVPEVKEKLNELGIPTFVDHSSYEEHPLGRTEWVKVYGVLFGKEKEAKELFEKQLAFLEEVKSMIKDEQGDSKKKPKMAFFGINSSGRVNARRHGDYISRMIELAGGEYAYQDVADATKTSFSLTMEMEVFYKETLDTDIIVYNTTISGGFEDIPSMVAAHPHLEKLPAVMAGNVWETKSNFYQDTLSHGEMILEFHKIINGTAENEMKYFRKLKP